MAFKCLNRRAADAEDSLGRFSKNNSHILKKKKSPVRVNQGQWVMQERGWPRGQRSAKIVGRSADGTKHMERVLQQRTHHVLLVDLWEGQTEKQLIVTPRPHNICSTLFYRSACMFILRVACCNQRISPREFTLSDNQVWNEKCRLL